MTATYNTVNIGGTAYDVYSDIATADDYLNAEFTDAATRWRDSTLTDDMAKARALVSATRLIDRQSWPGSRTDEYQVLEWPRTGTGISDVDENIVPARIEHACILLAADINNGTDVIGLDSTDDRQKRLKAGSVEIEYFRDLDGGPRFPTAVWELLSVLMGGGATITSSVWASGTDTDSDFATDYSPSGVL